MLENYAIYLSINTYNIKCTLIITHLNIKLQLSIFLASRAIHSQTIQQEDGDYEVITAYVEDNSVGQDHDMHSGPASIKVSF